MIDYTERLFEEDEELKKKIESLEEFILSQMFDVLGEVDKSDLREQLSCMQSYLAVLYRRTSRICT